MADNNTVARPYAQAVFDIANEAGDLVQWSESLTVAGQLLADVALVEYLTNPEFNNEQRLKFLTGLFKQSGAKLLAGGNEKGTNFLKLLLENRRIAVMPEIAEHYETQKAKVENTVDAVVTSATELSKSQVSDIAATLKKRLGCDINVETDVDENLIGGAVIRAGDVVIDGSLRARLESLAIALIK
ncbi:MAG: F0F1 ATP synthase subunit delta [Woeseiaceae bacterium]|jgi:F-type H+-transporting ATPase subunit delta|nr:F0F1 ATP synthase subunit delta [Woeseiaceae bacterium]